LNKQAVVEQQSQHKLDDLRYSISLSLPHELNTVLNVISGLSSLLMQTHATAAPEDVYEMAEAIHLKSKCLQRLVQNFLLMAQLEVLVTNPAKMQALRNYHIDNAIEVVSDAATLQAIQHGREPDLQLELSATSVQIAGPKLKKIVDELVDNAFKFSPVGSPVRVYTFQTEEAFVLHISDCGRGLTADQIADLGSYMQFDRDVYEQQGMGLGVTIAKRLAELHGGEMTIESIPGKQTIVRVSLPD
jgi:signal transduction histidine kinase